MELTEYEEDAIFKKVASIKKLFEDENVREKIIIEQMGIIMELVLTDNWWEIAGRLSKSRALLGTGFQVRFDVVKNNVEIRSIKGKGG